MPTPVSITWISTQRSPDSVTTRTEPSFVYLTPFSTRFWRMRSMSLRSVLTTSPGSASAAIRSPLRSARVRFASTIRATSASTASGSRRIESFDQSIRPSSRNSPSRSAAERAHLRISASDCRRPSSSPDSAYISASSAWRLIPFRGVRMS